MKGQCWLCGEEILLKNECTIIDKRKEQNYDVYFSECINGHPNEYIKFTDLEINNREENIDNPKFKII